MNRIHSCIQKVICELKNGTLSRVSPHLECSPFDGIMALIRTEQIYEMTIPLLRLTQPVPGEISRLFVVEMYSIKFRKRTSLKTGIQSETILKNSAFNVTTVKFLSFASYHRHTDTRR